METIISISNTFSMGYSNESGHFYGRNITYSSGEIVREVFNENGEVVEEYSF